MDKQVFNSFSCHLNFSFPLYAPRCQDGSYAYLREWAAEEMTSGLSRAFKFCPL
jgi:hypothetical protein